MVIQKKASKDDKDEDKERRAQHWIGGKVAEF
jgi:hypothetical protein